MIKGILLLLLACFLCGCVGAAMESAHMSSDALVRDKYMEAALVGDVEAQYQVGRSYCCAPRSDADAFYNNRKATRFLCMAARQGHSAAAFELGRFHSGDRIEGVRWMRRTANLVRDDGLGNISIAYYWFKQASLHGHAEARQMMEELGKQDISRYGDPQNTPCTVDEVYGDISGGDGL